MKDERLYFTGKVWKYGDHISTDHILPSRYMTQVEAHELASHCMSGIDPQFSKKVQIGDVLAVGENMGYGSSREQAPQALKHAGIRVVIAKSFARIFYRNCFNVGIPAIVCPRFIEDVSEGDGVEVYLDEGKIVNKTTGSIYHFIKPPAFIMEYIKLGGLIPYLNKQLNERLKDSNITKGEDSL